MNAAGNIALAPNSQQAKVLQVSGIITDVAVQVGDIVKPGDLLVWLDTTDLERAVQQAQLNVATSQAALDKLVLPPNADDVAAAQAGLTNLHPLFPDAINSQPHFTMIARMNGC